jgi:hypothetical protein
MMSVQWKAICVLCFFPFMIYCADIKWRDDTVLISYSKISAEQKNWTMTVSAQANGEFFSGDLIGHFRLKISLFLASRGHWIGGISDCISFVSQITEVNAAIGNIIIYNDKERNTSEFRLADVANIAVHKFGDGKSRSSFKTDIDISFSGRDILLLSTDVSYTDCSELRTVGSWHVGSNWVGGKVPIPTDNVIFGSNSGVVILSEDITISQLNMNGGHIIAQRTGCKAGWSPWLRNGVGYAIHSA